MNSHVSILPPYTIVLELGEVVLRGGFATEKAPRFSVFLHASPLRTSSRCHHRYLYWLEVMSNIFIEHLGLKPKDCRVILIEKFLIEKLHRDLLFTVLLKDIQVQSVSMQADLHMSILTVEQGSGLLVDIGENESRSIAFVHGRPILTSLRVTPLGAATVRNRFLKCLQSKLDAPIDEGSCNELFERLACFTLMASDSSDAPQEDDGINEEVPVSVKLACGNGSAPTTAVMQQIFITQKNMNESVEILLLGCLSDPAIRDDICGASGLVLESLKSLDSDLRAEAVKRIVVCGGGGNIPGLAEGLCDCIHRTAELQRDLYGDILVALNFCRRGDFVSGELHSGVVDGGNSHIIKPFRPSHRPSITAWVGGSVFGALKGNASTFVTLQESWHTYKMPLDKPIVDAPEFFNERFVLLTAPDWMSLNQSDWRFFKGRLNNS